MRITLIYGLFDPRIEKHTIPNEVRYIGKSVAMRARMTDHIRESIEGVETYKCCWIRSLLKEGIKPKYIVLEKCENNWREREIALIKEYKEKGHRLTNATEGGEGLLGYKFSKECVLKRAEKIKKYKPVKIKEKRKAPTGESYTRWKNSLKGIKKTEQWKKNLSISHKGKTPSKQALEAAWEACKNRIIPEEELQKRANSIKDTWKKLIEITKLYPNLKTSVGFKIIDTTDNNKVYTIKTLPEKYLEI